MNHFASELIVFLKDAADSLLNETLHVYQLDARRRHRTNESSLSRVAITFSSLSDVRTCSIYCWILAQSFRSVSCQELAFLLQTRRAPKRSSLIEGSHKLHRRNQSRAGHLLPKRATRDVFRSIHACDSSQHPPETSGAFDCVPSSTSQRVIYEAPVSKTLQPSVGNASIDDQADFVLNKWLAPTVNWYEVEKRQRLITHRVPKSRVSQTTAL
ncbi:hypothetical protein GN958_ATG11913 [Phytophthora infestans]|uniref:Uncharacterized protein n=1 Tax=Phytophthora infestans TaxID=4787 RepID=A0A8S9UED6_PHYIN|nr:hypothetical protein GN958_ATG11913 [Phytophthora infestans]